MTRGDCAPAADRPPVTVMPTERSQAVVRMITMYMPPLARDPALIG
jgi:hypothetical protein